jgi:hypothetical protein
MGQLYSDIEYINERFRFQKAKEGLLQEKLYSYGSQLIRACASSILNELKGSFIAS